MVSKSMKWSVAGKLSMLLPPIALWLTGEAIGYPLWDRPVIQTGSPDVLAAMLITVVTLARFAAAIWALLALILLRQGPNERTANWRKRSTSAAAKGDS
jgi:hypothetical protein